MLRSGIAYQFLLTVVFFILIYIQARLIKQSGKLPTIRPLAAMDAIDDAVGRAAETGRPIHFTPGQRGEIALGKTAQAVVGLSIMSYICKEAAKKGARVVSTCANEDYLPLVLELAQQAAQAAGHPEVYREEDHHYFPDQSYISSVCAVMEREKIAGNVLCGYVTYDGVIIVETAAMLGAIQIGALPTGTGGTMGIFEACCDYTLIGEEAYIAGAYLSKDPGQYGAIAGADICKWIILILIILGGVVTTAGTTVPWY